MSDMWGYRPSYYLTHPLAAIREPWNVIVAFFQRGKRGWAKSDTWNMDMYLARVISDMLAHLAAHTHGCPAYFEGKDANFEAWDNWLQDMSRAYFRYTHYMTYPRKDEGQKEYNDIIKGMQTLFDHYASLGD